MTKKYMFFIVLALLALFLLILIPATIPTIKSNVTGEQKDDDNTKIMNVLNDFTKNSKKMDLDSVKPYFAVNEYINGYNMDKAKEIYGDLAKIPSIEERVNEITSDYYLFLLGFTLKKEPTDIIDLSKINLSDLSPLKSQLDLDELNILRLDIPMKETTKNDIYKNLITKRCNAFGSEDIAYRTILYELDSNTYYCGFTLYKYDGKWMIYELSCSGFSYVDATVVTLPASEDEYLDIIDEK